MRKKNFATTNQKVEIWLGLNSFMN
jgi:hypothetical protein